MNLLSDPLLRGRCRLSSSAWHFHIYRNLTMSYESYLCSEAAADFDPVRFVSVCAQKSASRLPRGQVFPDVNLSLISYQIFHRLSTHFEPGSRISVEPR